MWQPASAAQVGREARQVERLVDEGVDHLGVLDQIGAIGVEPPEQDRVLLRETQQLGAQVAFRSPRAPSSLTSISVSR